jgi:hypothetical protein
MSAPRSQQVRVVEQPVGEPGAGLLHLSSVARAERDAHLPAQLLQTTAVPGAISAAFSSVSTSWSVNRSSSVSGRFGTSVRSTAENARNVGGKCGVGDGCFVPQFQAARTEVS